MVVGLVFHWVPAAVSLGGPGWERSRALPLGFAEQTSFSALRQPLAEGCFCWRMLGGIVQVAVPVDCGDC